MSIRTDLTEALTPVTAELIDEFGVLVRLRRQVETPAPDGSALVEWRTVGGAEAPFRVVFYTPEERERRRIWGAEVTAEVMGIAPLATPIAVGDVLKVLEGDFADLVLRVERRIATEEGGITQLALADVPVRDDFGF